MEMVVQESTIQKDTITQTIRSDLFLNNKKITYRLVFFAFSADHRVKRKQGKKRGPFLRAEKVVEHER